MCGISLIIRKSGNTGSEKEAILRMVRAQSHRGPDGTGLHHLQWKNEEIWLGHNLLSITGTGEQGRQPMSSPDGNCGVVFNGEIYNADRLRKQLMEEGIQFNGDSDTEVLLNCLQLYGRRALEMLEGMYAFVFWDSQKEELLIHRDSYGIKPLFYAENETYLIFASEPAGIFAAGLMEFSPDTGALPYFLNYKFIPAPRTAWKEIRSAEAGEVLEYREGKLIHSKPVSIPEAKFLSLKEAMNEAFRAVIPADQPFGLALSGGIDSGLILAWCLEHRLKPVIFSVEFPEGSAGFSDTQCVKNLACKLDLEVNWISNEDEDFREITSCRNPWELLVADSAMILTRKIAKAAREKGLKILLSGAGADEWFGGYRRHAFFRNWLRIEKLIPEFLKRWLITGLRPGKLRWMNPADGNIAALWQAVVSSCLQSSLRCLPLIPLPAGAGNELEKMLRWDQKYFLPQDVLLITDFAGMAEGIETRFPFLHPALTSFADSIPLEQRMQGGRKGMLRDLYRDYFGPALAGRKKQGFGISSPHFLSEATGRMQLKQWCSELTRELPEIWNYPEWNNFQQAALKSPEKFFQEWIRIGRLCSWLQAFPIKKKQSLTDCK